jgi:hypothetical protein
MNATQVQSGLRRLHPKIVWWPDHNVVWIVNFFKHQCANGNPVTFTKSAANKLASFPPEVIQAVCSVYPALTPEDGLPTLFNSENATLTLPTPYPNPTLPSKVTVTVTGTDTETTTVPEGAGEKGFDFETFFEDIWQRYPTRPGISKAGKAETKLLVRALSPSEWPQVLQAVKNYVLDGRLPVDPIRFFKSKDYPNGFWRNFVTISKENGNAGNRQGGATLTLQAPNSGPSQSRSGLGKISLAAVPPQTKAG